MSADTFDAWPQPCLALLSVACPHLCLAERRAASRGTAPHALALLKMCSRAKKRFSPTPRCSLTAQMDTTRALAGATDPRARALIHSTSGLTAAMFLYSCGRRFRGGCAAIPWDALPNILAEPSRAAAPTIRQGGLRGIVNNRAQAGGGLGDSSGVFYEPPD